MKRIIPIIILIFSLVATLYAAFSSTETFDSYADEALLNGLNQTGTGWSGAWVDPVNGWSVEQTLPAGGQGGKALINTAADGSADRSFTSITAGVISWEMQLSITNPNDFMGVVIRETATGAKIFVRFGATGNIEAFNNSAYVPVASYAANVWYRIAVEFDDAAHPDQFRVQVNGQTPSAWMTVSGGTYTNINMIRFDASATGTRDFWVDDIKTIAITENTPGVLSFDSASSAEDNLSASALSWTHITSGSNRVLTVGCGISSNTISVSSMTYNGVAMNLKNRTTVATRSAELWYLANPAAGSNTVSVTLSAGSMSWACGGISFVEGSQAADPLGTAATNSGFGTTVSASPSTASASDMVVDVLYTTAAATAHTNTGANTRRYIEREDVGASALIIGSTAQGTGSTVQMSYSWTTSVDNILIAAAVKPFVSPSAIVPILSTQWRQRRQ